MLARCMDVRRRRIAVTVVACAMALAALPAVFAGPRPIAVGRGTVTAASGASASVGGASGPASGQQFAEQELSLAPLPAGATAWTAVAPAALDTPALSVGSGDLTDVHALYEVDQPAGRAMSDAALAQLPAGSSVGTRFTGGLPDAQIVGFAVSLPTSGPNESSAQLVYATAPAADGAYVLRIDAQVVWVPDRPPVDVISPPASAHLTGYANLSLANPSSGPVTVPLGEVDSIRLADAINALPLAAPGMCMENSLLYTITFYPMNGSGQTDDVSGWFCPRDVDASVGATHLPPLNDDGCHVIRLVLGFLPPQATGTRSFAPTC